MTDYQAVVEQMLKALQNDEAEYACGKAMSPIESVQGEIVSRNRRAFLEYLIKTCQIGET